MGYAIHTCTHMYTRWNIGVLYIYIDYKDQFWIWAFYSASPIQWSLELIAIFSGSINRWRPQARALNHTQLQILELTLKLTSEADWSSDPGTKEGERQLNVINCLEYINTTIFVHMYTYTIPVPSFSVGGPTDWELFSDSDSSCVSSSSSKVETLSDALRFFFFCKQQQQRLTANY